MLLGSVWNFLGKEEIQFENRRIWCQLFVGLGFQMSKGEICGCCSVVSVQSSHESTEMSGDSPGVLVASGPVVHQFVGKELIRFRRDGWVL